MRRLALSAAALALLAGLPACEGIKRHVNGDAGMRIQVDVYKGPLALDPEVQWGRLLGYLQEANTSIDHYIKIAMEELRYSTKGTIPEVTEFHPKDVCVRRLPEIYRPARGIMEPNPRRLMGEVPLRNDVAETTANEIIARSKHRIAKEASDKAARDRRREIMAETDGIPTLEWFMTFFMTTEEAKKAHAEWKTTLATRDTEISKTAQLGRSNARNLLLLQLLYDSCEAWELINNRLAAAIYWTHAYDKYRKESTRILTLGKSSLERHEEQLSLLEGKPFSWWADVTHYKGHPQKLTEVEAELKSSITDTGDAARQGVKLRKALQGQLAGFVEITARMKAKAGFWTWNHATTPQSEDRLRQHVVGFSILMTEYANRISSASDALLKQTYGADRREMPISELIRDTKPTHVANLLIFNGAMGGRLPHETYTGEYQYDRLRAIEQTYGDDSWSNINQAYASGRGDVAMAFIKDGVGNWNLKNFDQDPTEVIQAYKDLGLAALKTAVTAATGGGVEGVSRAQKLLALGNQLTTGGGGAVAAPEAGQVKQLREAAIAELEALAVDAQSKAKTIDMKVNAAQATANAADKTHAAALKEYSSAVDAINPEVPETTTRAEELRVELTSAKAGRDKAHADLAAARTEAANLSKVIAAKASSILASHARIISTLQSSIVETKAPAAPPDIPRLN
jgi:hypothetical protein